MFRTIAILACSALLLGGCTSTGGKVETDYAEPDFAVTNLRDGLVAIGGVVLGDRAELDPHAGVPASFSTDDQSLEWGPALTVGVLNHAPELSLLSYPAVRDQVPAGFLAEIQATYARRGLIRPATLAKVAQNLPGVNWLLLARVDESVLEGESVYEGHSTQGGPAVGRAGGSNPADPAQPALDRDAVRREVGMFGTVGRTVTMSLDIYDLRLQRSVWTGKVKRHHKAPGGPRTDAAERDLKLDAGGETPVVAGSSLAAPELGPVVADCCRDLAGSLAGEAKDEGAPR